MLIYDVLIWRLKAKGCLSEKPNGTAKSLQLTFCPSKVSRVARNTHSSWPGGQYWILQWMHLRNQSTKKYIRTVLVQLLPVKHSNQPANWNYRVTVPHTYHVAVAVLLRQTLHAVRSTQHSITQHANSPSAVHYYQFIIFSTPTK